MSDTKMLQSVLDGQKGMRQGLRDVKQEIKNGFQKVNKRIDTLGSQLAYLEDDAPTREEHEELEKRINKVETRVAST